MILFVCTGNIFRSLTAELALRALLGPESATRVASAGLMAQPQLISPIVDRELRLRGVSPDGHLQRRLSSEILDGASLVVAMGRDHQEGILAGFQHTAPLFNEICGAGAEPVLDVWEAVPDWQDNPRAAELHIKHVVAHIFDSMPLFAANYKGFVRQFAVKDLRKTSTLQR